MVTGESMPSASNCEEAVEIFDAILASLPAEERSKFEAHVRKSVPTADGAEPGDDPNVFCPPCSGYEDEESEVEDGGDGDDGDDDDDADASNKLAYIIHDLQQDVGVTALDPNEKIVYTKKGQFGDYDDVNTQHVDSFLYDDEEVEEMVEKNELARYYCLDKRCNFSRNTKPLDFISHSFSVKELKFIYKFLGDLSEATVLDIGSRLGAALYMGHLYSNAKSIVGVEMSKFFCKLQKKIVKRYQMDGRCKVVHADIFTRKDVVETADVVIMNNVFDMFYDDGEKSQVWKNVIKLLNKPGTRIVTSPPIEESLNDAGITKADIDVSKWLKEHPLDYPTDTDDPDEYTHIRLYEVMSPSEGKGKQPKTPKAAERPVSEPVKKKYKAPCGPLGPITGPLT